MLAKRLPFKIAEFAPRIIWTSATAREVWEPRISAVSAAWLDVEVESVARGVRRSALRTVPADALPEFVRHCANDGLLALPLERVAKSNGYQSAGVALQAGDPFDYRVAVTRAAHATEWSDAWQKRDDNTIGWLLQTPDCCRQFFERNWNHGKWMDTTWPMHATAPHTSNYLNMLWRWLGVRPVSHLPCSMNCQGTMELADHLADLLPAPERQWHKEILSWPARWTALRGLAEITTPILRMIVPTDATASKLEVRFVGWDYPKEGASGLDFPFQKFEPVVAPLRFDRPKRTDNGFTSIEAEGAAHGKLIAALDHLKYGDVAKWTVVDLGCGDGTLLKKIPCKHRVGVEKDGAVALKTKGKGIAMTIADCTDPVVISAVLGAWNPDLIIAQRRRNPPETLKGYRVLSYSYEDGAAAPELIEP